MTDYVADQSTRQKWVSTDAGKSSSEKTLGIQLLFFDAGWFHTQPYLCLCLLLTHITLGCYVFICFQIYEVGLDSEDISNADISQDSSPSQVLVIIFTDVKSHSLEHHLQSMVTRLGKAVNRTKTKFHGLRCSTVSGTDDHFEARLILFQVPLA